ncbi:4-hydroxyphenylpyruvate dioxygenase [Talaromyces islandicus]|uniref:4-hydroxyphenylpyruvate dioxygenase n=1 Tax=Talaromyces islandicus TaxID=28573 RepID=A0A0U1LNV0_TALIS|nr:4-hydroxyphenylpyruvate dioxygenase [Talaromyces islandicus]
MPCRPAIASMSLGRAWVHEMPEKTKQAAETGFQGIEIFYEDLEYLAKKYGDSTQDENILAAAKEVRELCDSLGLEIFGLQPFLFYEGLVDRQEHDRKIRQLKLWFRIVKVLGTYTIQIPTNFQQGGTSGDIDLITQDLIEVADLGIKEDPPIRFAYENIAWGTHVDTWELMWDIVQRVNRPNFGCCLDTFNIAGRVWADPASPTGKTANAENDFQASMERLRNTVDIKKVYYVQVVDAEHRGAYLPSVEVAKVLLNDLKFEGWVSMELFSRTLADPDQAVPRTHSQRGIAAWKKLQSELDL